MNNSSKIRLIFKKKNKVISSVPISSNNIDKKIRDLSPKNVHGHNIISIHLLKNCGESISKLLEIIFKSCVGKGQFPSEWKKANVIPVNKKGISKCQETTHLFHYI